MPTRALHEATLLVLTVLSRGSQHGSGIITEVQEISGGRVTLRAGTLYATLDRLCAAGLIGVDHEELVGSRLRRYYRLIPAAAALPASRPRPAPQPDLRIGDADREATAAALGEHFAQGRLTTEELLTRLDAALTAATQRELAQITADLPPPRPPPPGSRTE